MDLQELIQDSVRQVLAESSGTNAEPTAAVSTAQPISVNIQGQTYTFRDQADLEAQLNQVALAQRQAIKPPEPEPVKLTGSRVSGDEDSGFSNEEYIRMMNEDPRKATKYALSHLLFDGKVENPEELLRETMIQQATTNRQLATYQFKDAYRDVPIEDPRVGGTLEEVRKSLNLPFTAEGLEAAYMYSVGKGRLPDFRQIAYNQQQQAAQQQAPQYQPPQQQQSYNPYLAAPPAPGRSNSPSIPVTMEQIEDMPIEQHASLLRKLSAAGAV
jgi:hypothetical protein